MMGIACQTRMPQGGPRRLRPAAVGMFWPCGRTLGWKTPAEVFEGKLKETQDGLEPSDMSRTALQRDFTSGHIPIRDARKPLSC